MSQACVILCDKRYTPKSYQLAKNITSKVLSRYNQWVVSFKCLLDQSEADDLLGEHGVFAETVILSETERVTQYQRLLLEVEKHKVIEKRTAVAMKQKTHNKVSARAKEVTKELFDKYLDEHSMGALKIPEGFGEFLSFAYTPALNFKRLYEVTLMNRGLTEGLIELANNREYCISMNKTPKNICCVKTAIGFIGIDTCKELFPLLMVKSSLRWDDRNIPLIAPKLWQSVILTANVTRMRLESAGSKEAAEGMVIGAFRHLGRFAINNLFTKISEDALIQVSQEYREAGQMPEYYACAEITPKPGILVDVFEKWADRLTRDMVERSNWGRSLHLKKAIIEDLDGVDVLDRGLHGVALGQGNTFAIHHLMSQSNSFIAAHDVGFFANMLFDPLDYQVIKKQKPGKINLRK